MTYDIIQEFGKTRTNQNLNLVERNNNNKKSEQNLMH